MSIQFSENRSVGGSEYSGCKSTGRHRNVNSLPVIDVINSKRACDVNKPFYWTLEMSSRRVKILHVHRDKRGRNGAFSSNRALQEAVRKIKRQAKMLEK